MSLPRNKGEGSQNSFAKGAYIDEVTVISATDLSLQENTWGNKNDLAIEFEFSITGKDFTTKQTLGGNFKYNDKGGVEDWGGAFKIDLLVKSSGYLKTLKEPEIEEFWSLMESCKIQQRFLDYLKGKKMFKISYISGVKEDDPTKTKYSSYNKILFDKNKLIKTFLKDLEGGYPKNYAPDTQTGAIDESTEGEASFVPETVNEESPI